MFSVAEVVLQKEMSYDAMYVMLFAINLYNRVSISSRPSPDPQFPIKNNPSKRCKCPLAPLTREASNPFPIFKCKVLYISD
jgi:hypothetical protein